jgi:7-cyano-7-deazaguanine synthase in queuosine biosynthesis
MTHRQGAYPSYRVDVVEEAELKKRGVIQCEFGEKKSLSFNMEELAWYCFAETSPITFDALLLAAAVEFCDRTLRRGSEKWARKIKLRLPVHNVHLWNSAGVLGTLTEALNFLTGDLWGLNFEPRKLPKSSPGQRPLSLSPNAKAVVPFSDGLDSWSVATIVQDKPGAEFIRVRLLSKRLGRKSNDPRQKFASVPYTVRAKSNKQPETTGRHRGFKFAMISAIAAYHANVDTVIVAESGQGALGPALVPVGQIYPDYRSHPLFTMRMERFLAALWGRSVHYDFPRLWHTKGETLRAAIASATDPDAWKKSRSCWQGNRRAGIEDKLRQCGVCAACMLRRLSVHAAGLNEDKETYVWENIGTRTFEGGSASSFSKSLKPFREYAIAGALHMDHLAALQGSQAGQITLRRHAFELAEWRGESPAEIEIKLRGLLERHAEEWKNFISSLGPESFVRPWARTAA